MASVKFSDLSAAFAFVSFAAPMEHRAYISVDNGAIYWVSELNPIDEEVPDDFETSDRYIPIPHKNDLDLGNALALRFVEDELPNGYARVEAFFRHRGAYARFTELLAAEHRLDQWYAFEAESTERALMNWCAKNAIIISADNQEPNPLRVDGDPELLNPTDKK